MVIQFDVFGIPQLERDLIRMGEHAGNLQPVFLDLLEDFRQLEERQFRSQGAYASGGWAPIKPETIARKARQGLDPRILFETHRLFESLTEPGDPDQIAEVRDDELRYGTQVPYAEPLHRGSDLNDLPARHVIEFTGQDRVYIVKKIQRFIMTGEVGVL